MLGQSSVEAAVLLPATMALIGMLAQPTCLLYTRALMRATAAECARLVATTDGERRDVEKFARRRLEAVPEVSVFHVGGSDDWEVTLGLEGARATVAIVGHARPLPLLGIATWALFERDDTGVVLRVEVSEAARPEWLGGSYGEWVGVWGQ